jgi:hypothetical protein
LLNKFFWLLLMLYVRIIKKFRTTNQSSQSSDSRCCWWLCWCENFWILFESNNIINIQRIIPWIVGIILKITQIHQHIVFCVCFFNNGEELFWLFFRTILLTYFSLSSDIYSLFWNTFIISARLLRMLPDTIHFIVP